MNPFHLFAAFVMTRLDLMRELVEANDRAVKAEQRALRWKAERDDMAGQLDRARSTAARLLSVPEVEAYLFTDEGETK